MRHIMAWLCLLGIALAMLPAARAAERPQAQVAEGRLAGVWEKGQRVFRGIPYAAPPVGEGRWRPPAPPLPWPGTRDAAAFGPNCVQPPYPADSVYFEPARSMSEDCLTLNIWAPESAEKAPVIVWIHGGALLRGTSASPMYDGAEYAKRGIVFVSINYRLGVMGWLAHPGLSAEARDGASGNYGLRDQIAALEWVRANIGAFGGDAARVTLMGESAGAFSISYLLASPRAQGLFARAIMQSTNVRAVPRLREAAFGLPPAEPIGLAVAKTAGAGDVAALRAMDAEALTGIALRERFVSQPTVDGALIPDQLVSIFDRGEQTKVPILAGFNSGEIRSQRALIPPMPVDAAAYAAAIATRYGDLAPAYLRLYPASDIGASQLAATRDIVYGWSTERLARQMTASGQPAYFYVFDHCYPAAEARDLCAFHASELPFTFGLAADPAAIPPNWPRPAGAANAELARRMVDYWTGFVKTGTPAAPGAPPWPAYGAAEAYMHFASAPRAARDPYPGMFELHEEVMRRRRCSGEQWFLDTSPVASPRPPQC